MVRRVVDPGARRQPAPACRYGAILPSAGFSRRTTLPTASRGALENAFSAQLAATKAREGHGIAWLPVGVAAKDMASGARGRAGGPDWDVPIEIGLFRPVAPQGATAERLG